MTEVFLNQLAAILGADLDLDNDLLLLWDESAAFNRKITLREFIDAMSGLTLAMLANGGWRSQVQAVDAGTQPITFATPFPAAVAGNYSLSIKIVDENGNVPYDEPVIKTNTGFTIPNIALPGTLTYQALPYA